MIAKALLAELAEHLEHQFDYIVTDWGKPVDGEYRPTVFKGGKERGDTPLKIKMYGENHIEAYTFEALEAGKQNPFYLNITTMKVEDRPKGVYQGKYEQDEVKIDEAKLALFEQNMKDVKFVKVDPSETKVAKSKNIKCPSVLVSNYRGEDALFVTYEVDGVTVGAQHRCSNGDKMSVKGSQFKGAYHVLQESEERTIDGKEVVLLSESYSTAATVAELFPEYSVAACAGISQLENAYKNLQAVDRTTILLLDKTKKPKDNHITNKYTVGYKDLQIPYAILNQSISKFIGLTDFNDHAARFGKSETKAYLSRELAAHIPVEPEVRAVSDAGFQIRQPHKGKVVTYKTIKALKSDSSKAYIRYLAEANNVTEKEVYPILESFIIDHDGNDDELLGLGVFPEHKGIVANLAQGRYYDGKECYKDRPENRVCVNVQTMQTDLTKHSITKKTINELEKRWAKMSDHPTSYLYAVIGWAYQAALANITEYRPHLWLTGATGSGKSVLMNQVVAKLFKGLAKQHTDVTKSGISQAYSPADGTINSPILLIDEAAQDTQMKRNNSKEILALLRAAATNPDDSVDLRGTADQEAKTYNNKFSAALASVAHELKDPQDHARFITLEINNLVQNTSKINDLVDFCASINNNVLSELVSNADQFKQLVDECLEAVNERHSNPQLGHKKRSVAYLMAGLGIFLNDKTPSELYDILQEVIKNQFYEYKALITGGATVLEYLNTLSTGEGNTKYSFIDRVIEGTDNYEEEYNIKYNENDGCIYVAAGTNYKLDRLLEERSFLNKTAFPRSEESFKNLVAVGRIKKKPQVKINKKNVAAYVIKVNKGRLESCTS